jgi:hypothetical protein
MGTLGKVMLWLTGIPLLALGVLGIVASNSDPHELGLYGLVGFFLALFGSLLCFVALYATLSGWFHPEPPRPPEDEVCPPGKHLCPHCGCRVADGSKTCRWCGADQD